MAAVKVFREVWSGHHQEQALILLPPAATTRDLHNCRTDPLERVRFIEYLPKDPIEVGLVRYRHNLPVADNGPHLRTELDNIPRPANRTLF